MREAAAQRRISTPTGVPARASDASTDAGPRSASTSSVTTPTACAMPGRGLVQRLLEQLLVLRVGLVLDRQRLGVVRAAGLDRLLALLGRRLELDVGQVGEQPGRPRRRRSCRRSGPRSGVGQRPSSRHGTARRCTRSRARRSWLEQPVVQRRGVGAASTTRRCRVKPAVDVVGEARPGPSSTGVVAGEAQRAADRVAGLVDDDAPASGWWTRSARAAPRSASASAISSGAYISSSVPSTRTPRRQVGRDLPRPRPRRLVRGRGTSAGPKPCRPPSRTPAGQPRRADDARRRDRRGARPAGAVAGGAATAAAAAGEVRPAARPRPRASATTSTRAPSSRRDRVERRRGRRPRAGRPARRRRSAARGDARAAPRSCSARCARSTARRRRARAAVAALQQAGSSGSSRCVVAWLCSSSKPAAAAAPGTARRVECRYSAPSASATQWPSPVAVSAKPSTTRRGASSTSSTPAAQLERRRRARSRGSAGMCLPSTRRHQQVRALAGCAAARARPGPGSAGVAGRADAEACADPAPLPARSLTAPGRRPSRSTNDTPSRATPNAAGALQRAPRPGRVRLALVHLVAVARGRRPAAGRRWRARRTRRRTPRRSTTDSACTAATWMGWMTVLPMQPVRLVEHDLADQPVQVGGDQLGAQRALLVGDER